MNEKKIHFLNEKEGREMLEKTGEKTILFLTKENEKERKLILLVEDDEKKQAIVLDEQKDVKKEGKTKDKKMTIQEAKEMIEKGEVKGKKMTKEKEKELEEAAQMALFEELDQAEPNNKRIKKLLALADVDKPNALGVKPLSKALDIKKEEIAEGVIDTLKTEKVKQDAIVRDQAASKKRIHLLDKNFKEKQKETQLRLQKQRETKTDLGMTKFR